MLHQAAAVRQMSQQYDAHAPGTTEQACMRIKPARQNRGKAARASERERDVWYNQLDSESETTSQYRLGAWPMSSNATRKAKQSRAVESKQGSLKPGRPAHCNPALRFVFISFPGHRPVEKDPSNNGRRRSWRGDLRLHCR